MLRLAKSPFRKASGAAYRAAVAPAWACGRNALD